jgi:hypothetical protein
MDGITEPVNVRWYIRQQWTKDKVVIGRTWPMGDRTINGCPIPQGYARITIDKILDKKYNKIRTEYPIVEDRPKLGHNKGPQVAWRKRFNKLDHKLSSDDEDDYKSSAWRKEKSLLLLLLLPLHQPRENRILLLLHISPKQDQRHPRSHIKGPWIRSLMLPKWTNKKTKGHSVAALQT